MPIAPTIDVERHVKWARGIARGVRADYGFIKSSDEENEIQSAAYLELVRAAHRFDFERVPAGGDPDGLFRAFSGQAIRKECQRESLRLRNGGLYNTTQTPELCGRPLADVSGDSEHGSEVRRRLVQGRDKRFVGGVALPLGDDPEVSYRMHAAGMTVEGEPDLTAWAEAVGRLAAQQNGTLWALGDLVVYGAARWGAEARGALAATGYSSETARVAAWVCRRLPPVIRITALSFGHHRIVAGLRLKIARGLLLRAAREGLGTRALRDLVRGVRAPAPPLARPATGLRRAIERLGAAQLERLAEAAARHGIPLEGASWPALEAVLTVVEEARAVGLVPSAGHGSDPATGAVLPRAAPQ